MFLPLNLNVSQTPTKPRPNVRTSDPITYNVNDTLSVAHHRGLLFVLFKFLLRISAVFLEHFLVVDRCFRLPV